MAESIFLLCAVMSAVCFWYLIRGYSSTKNKLLLWSGLCFAIIAASNVFLCVDLILYPNLDMHGPFWRNALNAAAGSVLLWGLILELS